MKTRLLGQKSDRAYDIARGKSHRNETRVKEYIALDSHKQYTIAERESVAGTHGTHHRINHKRGAIQDYLMGDESGTVLVVKRDKWCGEFYGEVLPCLARSSISVSVKARVKTRSSSMYPLKGRTLSRK